MHTEIYCDHLAGLDPIKAIRAIHMAWLQINAGQRIDWDCLDWGPTKAALAACLHDAGHVAFLDPKPEAAERRVFGAVQPL